MKKRILIIDADTNLGSIYVKAFEQAGYRVARASGAQSAIAACEHEMPDVILLELQLQTHGGVEFLYELRSYPEWQGIPVVLNTLVPKQNLQKFESSLAQLNVVGYAYKPDTSLNKLIDLVDGVFARQS